MRPRRALKSFVSGACTRSTLVRALLDAWCGNPYIEQMTKGSGPPVSDPFRLLFESRLFGRVAHRFEVVAVGVMHERRVVVLVVVRTHARCAVVLAAGRSRCRVEGVDACAVLRGERDVRRAPLFARPDPEVGDALAGAEAGRAGELRLDRET